MKRKNLFVPGAILLSGKLIHQGGETYRIPIERQSLPNPWISYRLNNDKFLGIVGDLAEYEFNHVPKKSHYNNIPKLELLNSIDQDYLGSDEQTLRAFEESTFFTEVTRSFGKYVYTDTPEIVESPGSIANPTIGQIIYTNYAGYLKYTKTGWTRIVFNIVYGSQTEYISNYSNLSPDQIKAQLIAIGKGILADKVENPKIGNFYRVRVKINADNHYTSIYFSYEVDEEAPEPEIPDSELDVFKPRYFGTALDQNGNTVVLVILPPNYGNIFLFNGSDIDTIDDYINHHNYLV